jgi:hypothetical protein
MKATLKNYGEVVRFRRSLPVVFRISSTFYRYLSQGILALALLKLELAQRSLARAERALLLAEKALARAEQVRSVPIEEGNHCSDSQRQSNLVIDNRRTRIHMVSGQETHRE